MADEERKGVWVGGVGGAYWNWVTTENFPAITKLARQYEAFQNSPYRGEWDQKMPTLTAGEVRDILIEIARGIK